MFGNARHLSQTYYQVHKVGSLMSLFTNDLDTVLEGYSGEDGCVYPQVNTGRAYDDYLRILLYAKDENIKTARILDLIQINMRKDHDGFFLVPECATGVSIDADVYGRKLSYDRIY